MEYLLKCFKVLDLTPLPFPTATEALLKWNAEPVKYLFLPSSTFIANMKGYPVLPKATQSFIREMMAAGILPSTPRPSMLNTHTFSSIDPRSCSLIQ